MSSLFKYLPSEYVYSFINEGKILFRSLSYFQNYEDNARGDEFEGTRRHRPKDGLTITLSDTEEKIVLPHTLEASVNNTDDIFVFCLSEIYSENLALKFNANAYIEILNPGRFIGGIRQALQRRPSIKNKTPIHGKVKYYTLDEDVITDWALPEKIAMSKLIHYSPQNEYRIAYSLNNAFEVGNTQLRLGEFKDENLQVSKIYPEQPLKIGCIDRICKVHYFK